jgi:hypothetical protein
MSSGQWSVVGGQWLEGVNDYKATETQGNHGGMVLPTSPFSPKDSAEDPFCSF